MWIVPYKYHRPISLHNWFRYEDTTFVHNLCIWGHDDGRPRRKSMLLEEFVGELGPLISPLKKIIVGPVSPAVDPVRTTVMLTQRKNKSVSVNCKRVSKDLEIKKGKILNKNKRHIYQI